MVLEAPAHYTNIPDFAYWEWGQKFETNIVAFFGGYFDISESLSGYYDFRFKEVDDGGILFIDGVQRSSKLHNTDGTSTLAMPNGLWLEAGRHRYDKERRHGGDKRRKRAKRGCWNTMIYVRCRVCCVA